MVASLGKPCVAFMTDMTSSLVLAPQDAKDLQVPGSFWSRIAHELADAIGQGVYAPGERLPSEHALAGQFGVNRHTLRQAVQALVQEGHLRVQQGSGTYVEDVAVEMALLLESLA